MSALAGRLCMIREGDLTMTRPRASDRAKKHLGFFAAIALAAAASPWLFLLARALALFALSMLDKRLKILLRRRALRSAKTSFQRAAAAARAYHLDILAKRSRKAQGCARREPHGEKSGAMSQAVSLNTR
jgi:hypothetical protein